MHHRRRADFPGPGPPSWPVPGDEFQLLSLIFLLSPAPFPAGPPGPPSSGWPPSHTDPGWKTSLSKGRSLGIGRLKAERGGLLRAGSVHLSVCPLLSYPSLRRVKCACLWPVNPLPPTAPTSAPRTQDLPQACGEHLKKSKISLIYLWFPK